MNNWTAAEIQEMHRLLGLCSCLVVLACCFVGKLKTVTTSKLKANPINCLGGKPATKLTGFLFPMTPSSGASNLWLKVWKISWWHVCAKVSSSHYSWMNLPTLGMRQICCVLWDTFMPVECMMTFSSAVPCQPTPQEKQFFTPSMTSSWRITWTGKDVSAFALTAQLQWLESWKDW